MVENDTDSDLPEDDQESIQEKKMHCIEGARSKQS